MKTILLDISAISKDPALVNLKHPDIKFVVPGLLMKDLEGLSSSWAAYLKEILRQSIDLKNIEVFPIDAREAIPTPGIYDSDAAVVALARIFANSDVSNEAWVATENDRVKAAAQALGLTVTDTAGVRKAVSDAKELDTVLAARVRSGIKAQRKRVAIQLITGVALAVLGVAIWRNIESIVSYLTIWGTIVLLLFVALLLYAIRGRYLMQYAVAEFVVGLLMAGKIFFPDFDYAKLDGSSLLSVIAGIYVMVRGQDNLGKALQGTRYESFWAKYSGEKSTKLTPGGPNLRSTGRPTH